MKTLYATTDTEPGKRYGQEKPGRRVHEGAKVDRLPEVLRVVQVLEIREGRQLIDHAELVFEERAAGCVKDR
jgi:hypothetical protein